MEQKRKRGRLKGTQINDSRPLNLVADLMIKEPDLKKTPAIRRVVEANFREHDHSKTIRRLLRRWKDQGEERLAEAKARRDEAKIESTNYGSKPMNDLVAASHFAALNTLQPTLLDRTLAEIQRAQKMMEPYQRIADALNSPALKAVQEQQHLMDIIDPPATREIRKHLELIKLATAGF